MKHGKVVFRFLLPPDENATKAIHPTMGALYYPAAGAFASFALEFLSFLAPCPNMCCEAKLGHDVPHFLKVIPFVETEILRSIWCGYRPFDHDALQRGPHQLHVIAIGAGHGQSERDALAISQQTAFGAGFAAIGWIGADFFPRPMAPWSLRRPYSPSSSRYPATHQNTQHQLARDARTRRLAPILEIGHAPLSLGKSRFHSVLSTDNPCATRRRSHRHTRDPASVAVRHQIDADFRGRAVMAATPPTIHRIHGTL